MLKTTPKSTKNTTKSTKAIKTSPKRSLHAKPAQIRFKSSKANLITSKLSTNTTHHLIPSTNTNTHANILNNKMMTGGAFAVSHPTRGMTVDPLNTWSNYDSRYTAKHTFISTRSAGSPISVLLVGYRSHVGQHLYTHLTNYGFNVHPVSREPADHRDATAIIPIYAIEERGLPDVDFIINCQGLNPWNPLLSKSLVYDSRVGSNKFWADEIRKTSAKPYAFITMSSAFQYPPSNVSQYDETYNLPALSTYLNTEEACRAFDDENGFTFIQRLSRDSETHSRVFIPEIDTRTPEQLVEYERVKKQYDLSHMKSSVYGDSSLIADPQSQRERSVRHQLLTNDQVRVVNMRHGMLLSKTMQEFKYGRPAFDRGKIGTHIAHPSKIPAMHIDDFCQSVIHCMTTHNIYGAVNAVMPETPTNEEVLHYASRLNQFWTKHGSVSHGQIDELLGPEAGPRLYENRDVKPTVLQNTGFEWRYPNIKACQQGGMSLFEHEIDHYGKEGLYRNAQMTVLQ